MSVKLTEYGPVTSQLFEVDENDEEWKCPVPGMEDVWVRIIPPSWGVDRDRQQFVNGWHSDPRLSVYDLAQYEIALCYGGTNMQIVAPKRDENGRMIFVEEEPGYETETIKFDVSGQMNIDDVVERISKLPDVIVRAWHDRTMEVADSWQTRFRQ
jgi:hypothetical protein